ncbi:Disease resistance protein [Quillaja saponaria]|uniref:Disease resistance protein n=1 Tax=Quillaja saponaria TaxID=32244 RepID=A0AAD7VID9_QUISA|nr:Disease resistance protein [Quillaja saponaria]
MGGLGKTTLAQLAFNDDRLEGVKRFLIVLDDVWNGNYVEWVGLRNLVTDGAKGSKILVTTRNKNSALMMVTVSLYHLAGLPDDYCWSLFEKWAFREGESARYQNLVIIGLQLVGNCRGVPIAIRALGSLLSWEREESYWLFLKNNKILDIPQMENDILPMLRLSYDQLPPNLKECFAYCSLLPKGQEFDKDTLIQLWMAQDFTQSSNSYQQLEDIVILYFDELVSRSFFDVVG